MIVQVSVIVATYRREKELARALASLQLQTYREFEVIVIDDNADKEWNAKVQSIVNKFGEESDIPIRLIVNSINQGCLKIRAL